MNAENWSDRENDAVVAVYFQMLMDDLAGRAYNKAMKPSRRAHARRRVW